VRSTASSSTTFSAERRALARYFLVGGTAACVDVGLFTLFARQLALAYQPVAAATFILATLVNYVLSIRYVFHSGRRLGRRWEIAMVYAVSAVGLAINAAILWAAVEIARLDLLPAKLVATGCVFFWNYLARRLLVFGALRS